MTPDPDRIEELANVIKWLDTLAKHNLQTNGNFYYEIPKEAGKYVILLRALSATLTELRQAKESLEKEVEQMEIQSRTTYHGPWKVVESQVLDAKGNDLYNAFMQTSERFGWHVGCSNCLNLTKKQAEAVVAALNKVEVQGGGRNDPT